MKYGLTQDNITWIEDILSNDENSTDDELVDYFHTNGLTVQQARDVVSHRDTYLGDIVFTGHGPLWEAP